MDYVLTESPEFTFKFCKFKPPRGHVANIKMSIFLLPRLFLTLKDHLDIFSCPYCTSLFSLICYSMGICQCLNTVFFECWEKEAAPFQMEKYRMCTICVFHSCSNLLFLWHFILVQTWTVIYVTITFAV